MRKPITKKLLLFGTAASMIFASCSRQMASTKTVDKMMYAENMPDTRVQPVEDKKTDPPLESCPLPDENESNTTKAATEIKPDKHSSVVKIKDRPKKMLQAIKTEVTRELQKQTAFINSMTQNHYNTSSYTRTNQTQGLLGIAGLFLIVAIAMAVFGLINMGAIFWDIAVVLLIAAIVFFILYLIAKAAGPSTP